ncbi:hypothetical protein EFY79_08170 [Hanamia caeni]|uniref:Uncharacterized protein n=1 Tax=Hanamia caeni TaxID=2294116 RepID=A0A3M9NHU4_9BACT|nr:hypothetical protein EFY79_08170 [Hanamia caeni]
MCRKKEACKNEQQSFLSFCIATSSSITKNKIKFRFIYCFTGEVGLGNAILMNNVGSFVIIYPPEE